MLREACDQVVFAVPAERVDATRRAHAGIERVADAARRAHAGIECVAGGATRSESVRNALAAARGADIVVVHDAARPFVTADLIRACVGEVEAGWDGAIAAAPVTDTIKEAGPDGRVIQTLDRSRLWSVQTPQAFRAGALVGALRGDVASATDDASLVEAAGGRVRIVEAPPSNFKITYPEDLQRAEALLC